jgi:hypothetical protein
MTAPVESVTLPVIWAVCADATPAKHRARQIQDEKERMDGIFFFPKK